VHAHVPFVLRDLGRIGARLVDGTDGGEGAHRVRRGAEPDRVAHAKGEILRETALDGDGRQLRHGPLSGHAEREDSQ
jgi:hypothetical protein